MASPYWHETLVTCGVVGGWMVASGGIVLFNKWVMVEFDFHFPATLTFMHMASSWLMANFLCKICAVVPLPELSWTQIFRSVVPISLCFSTQLVLSNYSYLYISIAYIQILKAFIPCINWSLSIAFGLANWEWRIPSALAIITCGIVLATGGERNFSLLGFGLQLGAIFVNAGYMVLGEVLLKQKGVSLNPVTTVYYVAPWTSLCIVPAILFCERGSLDALAGKFVRSPHVFIGNCLNAFLVNVMVYAIIGRTSAVTMGVAGIFKDIVTIAISVVALGVVISMQSSLGFGIAIVGVCLYNYFRQNPLTRPHLEDCSATPKGAGKQNLMNRQGTPLMMRPVGADSGDADEETAWLSESP